VELTDLDSPFDHQKVLVLKDRESGVVGVIAIHSSVLGPAMGGLRLYPFPTLDAAIDDVLRLSRAMSLKNATAGLDLGGGKAVLIDDGGWVGAERQRRMHIVGRAIESLRGSYVTAEDVGTTTADMDAIATVTSHVAGRSVAEGGRGDPSPYTARTVFGAIESGIRARLGFAGPAGIRVGVQGVGQVGERLVELLTEAGAIVSVADLDTSRAAAVAAKHGATAISLDELMDADLDVFAPCALGGAIDANLASRLRAVVVAGAANNPLTEDRVAAELDSRGILYVPDFVANCGGIIHVGAEALGLSDQEVEALLAASLRRTDQLLVEAAERSRTPLSVATEMAWERLRAPAAGRPGAVDQ
jgi:leucine dehydrogenase